MTTIPEVTLPNGEKVSRLGQGTWCMGEDKARFSDEVAAIRYGLELGMNLIDTAEMYGEGGAEEVVGEAIKSCRSDVYLVSKVYPHNAGRKNAIAACERSLKRLGTDCLDLYLLHWRGNVPLAETVDVFETLVRDGKIRAWGVSNFDTSDMEELLSLPNGKNVQTNQVLYNLKDREAEWSLMPFCDKCSIPLMAYCPLGQGDLSKHETLSEIASRYRATAAQIALAWLLKMENVVSIPKAIQHAHILQNLQALDITLHEDDMALLEKTFPAPKKQVVLGTV